MFFPAVILTALLGGSVFTASAAPLSFLNDTITASFPAKDLPALRSQITDVLNHSSNGVMTQWESSSGKLHRPIRVAITPLEIVETRKANTCRLLDFHVSQLHSSEKWRFWFCRQNDGHWKASGSIVSR